MPFLPEFAVEQTLLEQLTKLKYKIETEDNIGPDGKFPERESHSEVILIKRLLEAAKRINDKIPKHAIEEAVNKLTQNELFEFNTFYCYLIISLINYFLFNKNDLKIEITNIFSQKIHSDFIPILSELILILFEIEEYTLYDKNLLCLFELITDIFPFFVLVFPLSRV